MAIPESFVLTAGALHQAKFALGGLIVDEKKMAGNLDISRGLIVAEAVMMGLAPDIGRQEAHDVVYDACRVANEKGIDLADALSADPRVSARIDRATIDRLTSPRIISASRRRWSTGFWRRRNADPGCIDLRRSGASQTGGMMHFMCIVKKTNQGFLKYTSHLFVLHRRSVCETYHRR